MEKNLATLEDLQQEAASFVQMLKHANDGATLVTLSGELGAGKTSFTQGVAQALGVTDVVTSPTFVLEKVYVLPDVAPFKRLVHIDAYRLKDPAELSALGFDELMRDAGNLVLFEWPERVTGALSNVTTAITLRVPEGGGRTILYE